MYIYGQLATLEVVSLIYFFSPNRIVIFFMFPSRVIGVLIGIVLCHNFGMCGYQNKLMMSLKKINSPYYNAIFLMVVG